MNRPPCLDSSQHVSQICNLPVYVCALFCLGKLLPQKTPISALQGASSELARAWKRLGLFVWRCVPDLEFLLVYFSYLGIRYQVAQIPEDMRAQEREGHGRILEPGSSCQISL